MVTAMSCKKSSTTMKKVVRHVVATLAATFAMVTVNAGIAGASPTVPTLPSSVTVPTLPALQAPSTPSVPKLSAPSVPTLPSLPALQAPELPSSPSTPPVQSVPAPTPVATLPAMPSLSAPSTPQIAGQATSSQQFASQWSSAATNISKNATPSNVDNFPDPCGEVFMQSAASGTPNPGNAACSGAQAAACAAAGVKLHYQEMQGLLDPGNSGVTAKQHGTVMPASVWASLPSWQQQIILNQNPSLRSAIQGKPATQGSGISGLVGAGAPNTNPVTTCTMP